MTDMTKAIPHGWIAPSYDEDGARCREEDIRIEAFDSYGVAEIATRGEVALMVDVAQAKALIDALQQAVAEFEERP